MTPDGGSDGSSPDGTVAVSGTDVVTVDADGRLATIGGFLGDAVLA